MHRLVVALLAALDALIAAAVGVLAIVAPLALFWAIEVQANWSAIWPTSVAIWQSGHLVPLTMHVPETLLLQLGLPKDVSSFVFSLAPPAFAVFSAIFGARSGLRAARAGAWATGAFSGAAVFALFSLIFWSTSQQALVSAHGAAAVFVPALVYGIPMLLGALVGAWRYGDDGGWIDRLHDVVDARGDQWSELPALVGRGLGIVLVGFASIGALAVAVSIVLRGGEVVALSQSAQVDVWGVILLALAQFAYLPTMMVWGFSWVAGPGFLVGDGASVTSVATHLGVVPGVPMFGLIPQQGPVWLLASVLLPVALAAVAGWALRGRYATIVPSEPLVPRVVMLVCLAVLSAGAMAVIASVASGGIGPGRMEHLGVNPGWLALAVGCEVLIGAGAILLPPRSQDNWHTAESASFDSVPGTSGSQTFTDLDEVRQLIDQTEASRRSRE